MEGEDCSIQCQRCGHHTRGRQIKHNDGSWYQFSLIIGTSYDNGRITCSDGSCLDGCSFLVNEDHEDAIGHMDDICDFCMYEMMDEGIIEFTHASFSGTEADDLFLRDRMIDYLCLSTMIRHDFDRLIVVNLNMFYIEYKKKYFCLTTNYNEIDLRSCEFPVDNMFDAHLLDAVDNFAMTYSRRELGEILSNIKAKQY